TLPRSPRENLINSGKNLMSRAAGSLFVADGPSVRLDFGPEAGSATIDGTVANFVAVEIESRGPKQACGALRRLRKIMSTYKGADSPRARNHAFDNIGRLGWNGARRGQPEQPPAPHAGLPHLARRTTAGPIPRWPIDAA